jgi:nucleoid-associated protein YgaU
MSGFFKLIGAFVLGLSACLRATAGGSAETTLVVVNGDSPLSQRIANEYVRIRHIPETNIVSLSGVPAMGKPSIADFRTKIWGPIHDYIRTNGLDEEIDLIAYSGDFPYSIDIREDIKANKLPANRYRGDTASLTGLTYFARRVEKGDPGYLGVNHYFREFVIAKRAASGVDAPGAPGGTTTYGPFENPHGFRHRYVWSSSDLRFWEGDDVLDQYYLSTLLAYTGVRGNSFPEIAEYLRRATASDGTNPDGTVYLMENEGVRSTTRQPLFAPTVAELARRGRKAEILRAGRGGQNGLVPVGRDDVIGVVAGTKRFDWPKSRSRLLPGAIAESLTSYGGHFERPDQTKLTAFLRHGAAGSSGAVEEPWSLQSKFPVPLLHVYYADGCSLAEAFYQSILTPYQLVVVGDPLARPFARFATVGLKTPELGSPWSGVVRVEPQVTPVVGTSVRAIELWVDGQHVASGEPGAPIAWDTRTVDDGSHDLRLVAVEDGIIETRSAFRATVSVLNRDQRIDVTEVTRDVGYGEPIVFAGQAAGARQVEVRRGHRVLATVPAAKGRWSATVPSESLGIGEVSLFARAVHPDAHAARSEPLSVTIREPSLWPAAAREPPGAEGLAVTVREVSGGSRDLVVARLDGAIKELAKIDVKGASIRFSGFLKVARPGFHQLAIAANGQLRVAVHGKILIDDASQAGAKRRFIPLGLEAGRHPIEIELRPAGKRAFLKVVMAGEQVPEVLSKVNLAH